MGEDGFAAEVLEASASRPVVVDFWAPWCGPCRQLSPLLESTAARYSHEVDLVKVNVDEAPNLSRTYQVQGIPAVKAFRDGAVVAEFVGLQPAAVVEQLFAGIAPTPADRLVAGAAAAPDSEREERYREALLADPAHAGAIVGLAELLAARGDRPGAQELLARAPHDPVVARLTAELSLQATVRPPQELAALRARVARDDTAAVLDLGRALAGAGEFDEAVELLLRAVGDPTTRDDARAALLEIFKVLPVDEARVTAWRRGLAAALF